MRAVDPTDARRWGAHTDTAQHGLSGSDRGSDISVDRTRRDTRPAPGSSRLPRAGAVVR